MSRTQKWLLRAALTALAVLLTSDRRQPEKPAKPRKPAA